MRNTSKDTIAGNGQRAKKVSLQIGTKEEGDSLPCSGKKIKKKKEKEEIDVFLSVAEESSTDPRFFSD